MTYPASDQNGFPPEPDAPDDYAPPRRLDQLLVLRRPLVVFDLETTGRRPSSARIVQIGLAKFYPRESGRDPYRWASLVNPGIPIPEEATKVHGIDDLSVKDAPRFEAIAAKLAGGMKDCDFAGYNLRYDLECIGAEFVRANVPWSAEGAYVFDGFREEQREDPRTLSDVYKRRTGKDLDQAHDAMADVDATIEILVDQLEKRADLPRDMALIHALLFPRDPSFVDAAGKFVWENGVAVVSFGKWKGTPLHRVSKSYLEWMNGGDFAADTKRIVRDALAGRYPKQETAS